MKSLNQIIAELEDFATAHWQIHTFGHGDVWEISPQSSGIVYPVLWMVPQTATPTLNEVVDEFTILCMDLVDSGERNETEVLSDTRQIMLDVCAYYRQTHTNAYIIEFGGSIQPFTERYPERVSGHSLTIRIKQPHDYNLCAVPANTVPVPPIPSCADATVQNAASNPTYQASVASGGSLVLPQLKVLDSDGVTPILANYIPNTSGFAVTCTPPTCADATITVNTNPFGTAPSGGSLNVPVVNGGDNPVGSKQGSEWVIGNNATFINGTQVTDQEAEVDANIFVKQDGIQAGAWNAMTQTWEVTSAAPSISVSISDASPAFGDVVIITATPSDITPTSYAFYTFDGGRCRFIAEQASNVYNWTLDRVGIFDLYVVATDGVNQVVNSVSISTELLLDTYPSSSAAYSFFKLRSAYAGFCIRIRRSSDNAELNIGFIGWRLDTDSILAFVGAGNGFIVTFYDQSGSSFNYTQATAGLQPQIVVSGAIVLTLDSVVAANILNKNMANTMTNAATSSAFVVCQIETTGSDPGFGIPSLTINGGIYAALMTSGSPASPDSGYGSPLYYRESTQILPSTRGFLYASCVNGYKIIFSAIGGGSATSGRQLQYAVGWYGNTKLIAAIHYNSNQSANATGIRAILNSMYNVFV